MAAGYIYELKGSGKYEPVFIDMSELTSEEREIIVKMSDGWKYGKQVVLQSEFVKKDQSKG